MGVHAAACMQWRNAILAWKAPDFLFCALQVVIVRAESDVYVAEIDDSVVMKIGAGSYAPDDSKWAQAEAGHCWTVWYRR